MDMGDTNIELSDEEKLARIREIFAEFSEKVFAIEQKRDTKLSKIMDGIDQRMIDEVMRKLHVVE
jgi:uncharacterized membrane protein (DUF106 family)